MRSIRSVCAAALSLLLLAAPARATWSIILVDTRTGEIAIGSATCLNAFDLRVALPIVRVGRGAAAAQAAVPGTITNRQLIWGLLREGVTPANILAALSRRDPGHQSRQYGIVDVTGAAATFTGAATAAWAGGVTGSFGTVHYAIQGNILTGAPVVSAAEQAVINTAGDLAEKLMAGMQAARGMGGDGRCSCLTGSATSCGAPPASFRKSAHIGFVIVARQGDQDGTCSSVGTGCASGSYWLNLNIAFQATSRPDPVAQLQEQFDLWRPTLNGRPDHHLSTVDLDPPTLVPDGSATTNATVTLRDWRGTPLSAGGATVTVAVEPSSTATVSVGAVTDNGDGTYSFPVTAGTGAGAADLRIVADDGQGPVLLSPRTAVAVRDDPLWGDTGRMPAAAGGTVSWRLDAGTVNAGRFYALAASGSGTAPGIVLGASVLPLNPDPLFFGSLELANSSVFVNTAGQLDAMGRAQAGFVAPPGSALRLIVGADLHFAYALLDPFDLASNPIKVTVFP
ncbi:MAG: DUF1028 domain-containing protein [Planctomycetota bacterium]